MGCWWWFCLPLKWELTAQNAFVYKYIMTRRRFFSTKCTKGEGKWRNTNCTCVQYEKIHTERHVILYLLTNISGWSVERWKKVSHAGALIHLHRWNKYLRLNSPYEICWKRKKKKTLTCAPESLIFYAAWRQDKKTSLCLRNGGSDAAIWS